MSETTRILGIDPGLNRTGFGVIDAVGGKLTVVTAGCIRIPAGDLSERLGTIYRSLSQIIEETKPTVAAAEIVFVNINPAPHCFSDRPEARRSRVPPFITSGCTNLRPQKSSSLRWERAAPRRNRFR